jgi:hypothetical protein
LTIIVTIIATTTAAAATIALVVISHQITAVESLNRCHRHIRTFFVAVRTSLVVSSSVASIVVVVVFVFVFFVVVSAEHGDFKLWSTAERVSCLAGQSVTVHHKKDLMMGVVAVKMKKSLVGMMVNCNEMDLVVAARERERKGFVSWHDDDGQLNWRQRLRWR